MVYLLHLDHPLSPKHTAQHYIGWSKNGWTLRERMARHLAGQGANFTRVAAERGITFTVVRKWRGDKKFERALKNQKNARRLCPICNPDGYKTNMAENGLPCPLDKWGYLI